MFQFEIGMDPNLLEIGPFVLAWHGILTVLGIFVAVKVAGIGLRERNVTLPQFDSFAIWTIAGGIIGARLFFVLDHIDTFIDNPLEIFAITEGGLAIYGAVIGGFVTVAILCWIRNYPFLKIIDSIAPALVIAQAIGRIGCTINGDAWGERTDWAFALIYTNEDAIIPNRLLGEPTHPYPIYDIIMTMSIFAVIWPLRKRNLPDGAIFAIYALLYGVTRFIISYVREERVWFWGLQEAQVVSIGVLVAALVALVMIFRRQRPGMTTQGV